MTHPILQAFDFETQAVRIDVREGVPWFVAADVCRVLEITNPRDAVSSLDEDERGVAITDTLGGPQKLNTISESGLYALVFKSRKPESRRFRKWVTAEVLPAIRQTGRYEHPEEGRVPSAGGVMSVPGYIAEVGLNWPLDRQIDFGLRVRRFAKAMGVVFEVAEAGEWGRCMMYPRAVMERVRLEFGKKRALPDSDAIAFERLLELLLSQEAEGGLHEPGAARDLAQAMSLFPHIFRHGTSVESQRSAFGKLAERFNGRVFPGGAQLLIRGAVKRHYHVTRPGRADTPPLRVED